MALDKKHSLNSYSRIGEFMPLVQRGIFLSIFKLLCQLGISMSIAGSTLSSVLSRRDARALAPAADCLAMSSFIGSPEVFTSDSLSLLIPTDFFPL